MKMSFVDILQEGFFFFEGDEEGESLQFLVQETSLCGLYGGFEFTTSRLLLDLRRVRVSRSISQRSGR